MISIDAKLCRRCGICAAVCPAHCLEHSEGRISVRDVERCIGCGQCTAICAAGAIEHDGVPGAMLPKLGAFPSSEAVAGLIRGRRSVRTFTKKPVPRELLEKAFDTARYAPTGVNMQNVRWLVLEGRPALEAAAAETVAAFDDPRYAPVAEAFRNGRDVIFRGAPCAVFACAEEGWLSCANALIAASYLELLLNSMGLGTCWAGYVMGSAIRSAALRSVMGVKEGLIPHAGLMVGFPAVRYARVPQRKPADVTWVSR